MSLLRMSCPGLGTLNVKCTDFSSPMQGSISSAQTKTKAQHFPIKASQQSYKVSLICSSWNELKQIQDFTRGHHLNAIPSASNPEVMLWWPERGVYNWSGFIKTIQAGDKRFNIVPKITLEFLLVNSLLSEKTFTSSIADDFKNMFGSDIGSFISPNDPVDDGITPPSTPSRPADPFLLPGLGG